MSRRVVATGLGVISPNAIGTEEFWQACLAGKSGIAPIEAFDTTGFPVRCAGEVKGFKARDYVENRKSLKIMGRNIRFGVAATRIAVEHSGLAEQPPVAERFGIVMGSGIVPTDVEEIGAAIMESLDENHRFDLTKFGESGQKMLHPLWLLKHLPNMVAAHASIQHGARRLQRVDPGDRRGEPDHRARRRRRDDRGRRRLAHRPALARGLHPARRGDHRGPRSGGVEPAVRSRP